MSKPNTITALLAVIAVLLGLNLVAKSSPAAVGQGQAGPVQPVPVSLSVLPSRSCWYPSEDLCRLMR